jgi:IclR family pca regulon transcriptional regulator
MEHPAQAPQASASRRKAASARQAAASLPDGARTSGPEPDPRLFVYSIEKAATILELFETALQELSMNDIVARTDMGRSAVQRFVYSLHHLEYLNRNPDTKRYSLGPKVPRLYRGYIAGRSLLQRAQRVLMELNQATRESVSWVELLDSTIIVVESMPSPQLTSVTLSPGMRFEALSASSGQVLLAHASSPLAVQRAFEAASEHARQRAGTADIAAVHELLARIRAQGYSLTEKAFDQDSLSISAPVFAGRQAVAAINLSTLRARFDRREALKRLVPAIVAAARACSSQV